LPDHVAELLEYCRRVASPIPPFDAVLFLNTADRRARHENGWIAEVAALQSVADFKPVFDQLLVAGYSWLKLSAYGIFRGSLVIGVELPPEQVGVPPGLTSVNYSGPPSWPDGTANWDLDLTLTT
jgi:hypothetical protein